MRVNPKIIGCLLVTISAAAVTTLVGSIGVVIATAWLMGWMREQDVLAMLDAPRLTR